MIAVDLNHDIVAGKNLKTRRLNMSTTPFPAETGVLNHWVDDYRQSMQELKGKLLAHETPGAAQFLRWFSSGDPLPNIFEVLLASINIMETRITQSRLDTDQPDILIQPPLGHIRFLDFGRAAEIIEIGYESVRGKIDVIQKKIAGAMTINWDWVIPSNPFTTTKSTQEKAMNEHTTQKNQNRIAEDEARAAVEDGENIHEAVRGITLEALSAGHLDMQRIREVIQSVLRGSSLGAQEKGAKAEQALREAMAGVDEALAKSAEASKLAIEEAAGHIKEFGSQDLKRGLDDLGALEDMFLDTVKNIARASDGAVKDVLGNLAQHAHNTGTSVGAAAKAAAETLTGQLEKNVREGVSTGVDTVRQVGTKISLAAAGFLEGIAETLKKTGSNKKEQ